MKRSIRYVGLDLHAETIAVAVAEDGRDGEVRSLGIIPNTPESIRKMVKRLGDPQALRVCYEAGPCGYVLYWQLTELGVACEVIAPSLVPSKPGDKVKTDRRDATKLARSYRAGELTPVWVPDKAHEALRDLIRAREAAKADLTRARNRLKKFLLRQDRRPPEKWKTWGWRHKVWLDGLRFEQTAQQAVMVDLLNEANRQEERVRCLEQSIDEAIAVAPARIRAIVEALQTLRGVAKVTSVTIAAELGCLSRFDNPRQLMGYSGTVPSEYSSGNTKRQLSITKTGNAHLRRVIGEAAWCYRFRPSLQGDLKRRQNGQSETVRGIAWKAQHRLNRRYRTLMNRGKPKNKVITAVARELLGFIWAIGVEAERQLAASERTAA